MNSDTFSGTERYRLVRALGSGGMGTVYEVEDRDRGGARMALKLLSASDPENMLRFKREFRSIADIHHPNLVKLHELHIDPHRAFYTMELVEGAMEIVDFLASDVRHALATSPDADTVRVALQVHHFDGIPRSACSIPTLLGLLAQILDALEVLHARGIIHRDLKPANILVDREERVRLVDFGVVKMLDEVNQLSMVGYVSGTPEFMAPEYVMGGDLSPATDMYALGCVLYTLLSGRYVFNGSPREVMRSQYKRYPKPLTELVELPEDLAWVCLDLMHKNPEERPSIAAVRARLGLGRGEAGHRVEPPTELRVVGRSPELRAIRLALSHAHHNGPGLMVLTAPEGGGRTAVAREAARRASLHGNALALFGSCRPRESIPYRAFDPIIDELMLHINAMSSEGRLGLLPLIEPLVPLFPSFQIIFERLLDEGHEAEPAAPAQTRDAAFEAMRQMLGELAQERPLLLVIDDLHLADDDSLELLRVLTLDAPEEAPGWLVLVTCATHDDVLLSVPVRELVEGHLGHPRLTTLELSPLGAPEVTLLMSRLTGEELEPAQARALVEQTQGNPLLLMLLGSLLGAGEERAGEASVKALVRRQLESLERDARRVVELVAAYGKWVSADTLRSAAGMNASTFEATVSELVHRRVLRSLPRRVDLGAPTWGYDFILKQMREVVYETLRGERRQTLHRTLAHQIERQSPRPGRSASRDLVGQLTQSGLQGRGARFALEAAEQAADQWAYGSALALYRRVLDEAGGDGQALIHLGADQEALSPVLLRERIAEMLELKGDLKGAAHELEKADDLCVRRPPLADAAAERHPLISLRPSARGISPRQRIQLRRATLLHRTRQLDACRALFQSLLEPLGVDDVLTGLSAATRLQLKASLEALALLPRGWGGRSSDLDRPAAIALLALIETLGRDSQRVRGDAALRLRLLARRLQASRDMPEGLRAFLS